MKPKTHQANIISAFCKHLHTYTALRASILYTQSLAKKNALITLALLCLSIFFGLWSIFVLGILYERKESSLRVNTPESSVPATLPTDSPKHIQPQDQNTTKSNIGMGDSIQALSTKTPQIPTPNTQESIIAGNLTYTNAIAIAKSNLLAQDFTRARIWLYRAFVLHNSAKEVWELYWQSFEQDYHATIEQKQAAYTLYLQAKRYYGF